MTSVFVALLSLALVAVVSASLNAELTPEWELFKTTHNKQYPTGRHELGRRQVWESNLAKINAHNARYGLGHVTFELGMNHLGDLTAEEIKATLNGYQQTERLASRTLYTPSKGFQADATVDWRTKGAVTEVKNQGQCGSCWAFSATGSIEGQHVLRKQGPLVSLSEQQIADCSNDQGNHGCNGGTMDKAFNYVIKAGGLDSEACYAYQPHDGQCHYNASCSAAHIDGYVDIQPNNETALESAIAEIGPISVAIDASDFSFQFYKSGVYYSSECSSDELDHGVLAVGYGTTDGGEKYYIVKNSWGANWGSKGYLLMSRGRDNNCGIATAASYPTIN